MIIINYRDSKNWEKVINSFENNNIYCSREYLASFMKLDNSDAKLFYFEDCNFRCAYVMQINDIANSSKFHGKIDKNKYFDMNSPYGYGGPIWQGINNKELKTFFTELQGFATEQNIVTQFIRFNPFTSNQHVFAPYMDILLDKQTIEIELASEEQIWNNISSKNRNMIRKAQKLGVEIEIKEDKESFMKFVELYCATMKRLNAQTYYYFNDMFFEEMYRTLKGRFKLFMATVEQKTICTVIVLIDKNYIHYHLSASDPNYRSIPANNLLLYEAACWGSSNGLKGFHLGGGVKVDDSLYNFKKSFNKNGQRDFYIGRNVFIPEVFNELVEVRKKTDINFDEKAPYLIKYR